MIFWFKINDKQECKWLPKQKEYLIESKKYLKKGLYYVEIKSPEHMKSHDQLEYFHGVILEDLSRSSGKSKSLIKKELKLEFLRVPEEQVIEKLSEHFTGTEEEKIEYKKTLMELKLPVVTISLSLLTLDKMRVFIEKCLKYAAEKYGVVIKSPNQPN